MNKRERAQIAKAVRLLMADTTEHFDEALRLLMKAAGLPDTEAMRAHEAAKPIQIYEVIAQANKENPRT